MNKEEDVAMSFVDVCHPSVLSIKCMDDKRELTPVHPFRNHVLSIRHDLCPQRTVVRLKAQCARNTSISAALDQGLPFVSDRATNLKYLALTGSNRKNVTACLFLRVPG